MRAVFLTGEWRWLAMLNWRVDPALLEPLVPGGTTLDSWQGATYVSVVGFLFKDTRVLGVPVPLHTDFEEVNLRFYVRRDADDETRRGVTFVKEIVPRPAIAAVARLAYNEPYVALAMQHVIEPAAAVDDAPATVRYEWTQPSGPGALVVHAGGTASPVTEGSECEFITEHYWGYTRQRDGGTVEYRVTHPRWRTWPVHGAELRGNLAELYGPDFGAALSRDPDSAFLAEGSMIEVYFPRRI
jgi:uncharacterized protein YqjF (DUF2071 family)